MTREQIEKKAKELGIKYQTPCHGIGDCEFEARQAATEMADWLLSHQWISIEDELPPHSESESNYVLILTSFGCPIIGCWDYKTNVWRDDNWYMIDYDITHWMPIPQIRNTNI